MFYCTFQINNINFIELNFENRKIENKSNNIVELFTWRTKWVQKGIENKRSACDLHLQLFDERLLTPSPVGRSALSSPRGTIEHTTFDSEAYDSLRRLLLDAGDSSSSALFPSVVRFSNLSAGSRGVPSDFLSPKQIPNTRSRV